MVYLNSISVPLVNISVFERILKWFMLSLQRMFCRLSNYSAKMTIGQKKEGVAMENEPDFGSGDRKWEE